MDRTYPFDVFISYSHLDEEWVWDWLLPRLKAAGLAICIDRECFDPGVPSLVNMERAVENSRKTLLILSPAWVASEWTTFESLLLQTSDPTNRQLRLIPLLLVPCELPTRLKIFTHADFTRAVEWESRLDAIIGAVLGKTNLAGSQESSVPPSAFNVEPSVNQTQGTQRQDQLLVNRVSDLQTKGVQPLDLNALLGRVSPIGLTTGIALPNPDTAIIEPLIYAHREGYITGLSETLKKTTWLAIGGGAGTGKTQLARAVGVKANAKYVWWVSLQAKNDIDSLTHLRDQLKRWCINLKGQDALWHYLIGTSLDQSIELIGQTVGNEGLLIVDDLPDYSASRELFDRLENVAVGLAQFGLKLITTSQREIPEYLHVHLGDRLRYVHAPLFTFDDVEELLVIAGAPQELVRDRLINLILATTSGHPYLVASTVYWLKRHEWKQSPDDLLALLKGEATLGGREQAERQILHFFDNPSRELLFRLSLLSEEFDEEMALRIAKVSPAIPYPKVSFTNLVGPTIDRLKEGRYKTSPLIRDSGSKNLSATVQRAVYSAAAEYYFDKKKIAAQDAITFVTHLRLAGRARDHIVVLIQFMMSIKTRDQAKYFDWTTWIYKENKLWPSEVPLGLKIMFRAAQVRVLALAGKDISEMEQDLDQLMSRASSKDTDALLFANLNLGPFLDEIPAVIAMQRAFRAVRLFREDRVVYGEELLDDIEDVIWFPVMRLKGRKEIGAFVNEVQKMNVDERQRLFEVKLASQATQSVVDRIWIAERDKPEKERDWDSALQLLDQIKALANSSRIPALNVAQARARAIVTAEDLNQVDSAVTILKTTPKPNAPVLAFIVDYTLGCILYEAGRIDEALEFFHGANTAHIDEFVYYAFDTKRHLTMAYSKLAQWDHARRHCIDSIRFAAVRDEIPEYERLEMFGELAYILWSVREARRACGALYGLVKNLLSMPDMTAPRFREVFNKTGHAQGWFLGILLTGNPPPKTRTGEPYTPVEAGLFGIRRDRLGNLTPAHGFSTSLLLTQLGLIADKLELYRMAWQVFNLADEYVRKETDGALLSFSKVHHASLAVHFSTPEAALAIGLDGVRALAVGKKIATSGGDAFGVSINLKEAWESIPLAERQVIEQQQLLYSVFGPMFTNMLGEDLSMAQVVTRMSIWEEMVNAHSTDFVDYDFWKRVMSFYKILSVTWGEHSIRQADVNVPNAEPLLQCLGYLVASKQQTISLGNALQLQAIAFDYMLQMQAVSQHMLIGVNRFIRKFWQNIADKRGFALNSPELFRRELSQIKQISGVKGVARLILGTRYVVGTTLPDEVIQRLEKFAFL